MRLSEVWKFTNCSLTTFSASLDKTEVQLLGRKFTGSCAEPFLLCGTLTEVIHCDGKVAQDMGARTRLKEAEEDLDHPCEIGLVGCHRGPASGMASHFSSLS